jgi:hypothetical protein
MKVLLTLLVLANVLDYLTFFPMVVQHGLSMEANPIAVWLAVNTGLLGITLVKFAGIAFVALTVWFLSRYSMAHARVLAILAIGIGTVGGTSNIISM